MTYREAEIIQWGIDRNIIGPTALSNRTKQLDKTYEEVDEIADAILEDEQGLPDRARDMARDGIGDVYVTLVLQAQMWGLTMEECIEQAWNQIKDRKGRMVNGIFVKDQIEP